MLTAIIILSVAFAALLAAHIMYRRQVSRTCRRIAFIKENDTNMRLLSDLDFSELNELEKLMNDVIEKSRTTALSAQRSEASLKKAISDISHDIRTPLTSLDGYFQLLSEAKNDEERQRYTGIIRNRIDSLIAMLEELFLYTKLQNEGYEPELTEINFSQLVFDTAFSFIDDFSKRGMEPQVDFCDEQFTVNANTEGVSRVIQNIIKNAIVHGSGNVALSLSEKSGKAVFSCSNSVDNPEEIDPGKVFSRFYKADEARTENSSGLGLSIAHDFTIKMGGKISAELEGDIFKIEIRFDILDKGKNND